MSSDPRTGPRLIDPRGQRFRRRLLGHRAGSRSCSSHHCWCAGRAGTAGVSSLVGTRAFVFGRPWPTLRRVLQLGPPPYQEPEFGPRFAQALGFLFLAVGDVLVVAGLTPLGWLPIVAVVGLQATLALTGYCLGCKLYGLSWWVPAQFDRFVLHRDGEIESAA